MNCKHLNILIELEKTEEGFKDTGNVFCLLKDCNIELPPEIIEQRDEEHIFIGLPAEDVKL
jgi:hypothetical protein